MRLRSFAESLERLEATRSPRRAVKVVAELMSGSDAGSIEAVVQPRTQQPPERVAEWLIREGGVLMPRMSGRQFRRAAPASSGSRAGAGQPW